MNSNTDIIRLKIERIVTIYSNRILIRLHLSIFKAITLHQHFSLNRYSSTSKYDSFVFFTGMYSNMLLMHHDNPVCCQTGDTLQFGCII
jgi:hypothetical protein